MQHTQIDLIIPDQPNPAVKAFCIKSVAFICLLNWLIPGREGRVEHVISGEIIVEYDSHVADDGQFLDEFLEEGGVEVEAVRLKGESYPSKLMKLIFEKLRYGISSKTYPDSSSMLLLLPCMLLLEFCLLRSSMSCARMIT